MRITEMIVGHVYIINDGYGYDRVKVLEKNPKECSDFGAGDGAKVEFVDEKNPDGSN